MIDVYAFMSLASRHPIMRHIAPQQISPNQFIEPGWITFNRHSDGIPVAIAKARSTVRAPEGTYPVPLPLGDVFLYRCTLPEISA